MKILIIEDKDKHILSAQKFTNECGHEVVIAKTYDEAEKCLNGKHRTSEQISEIEKRFDVVMTDMFLPATENGLSCAAGDVFGGTEQPYGLNFVLLAMRNGIKAIGLFTDGGHHDSPMTWALDNLGGYSGTPFTVGDVTVLCCSNGPIFTRKWKADDKDLPSHVPAGDPLEGAKDWMEFFLMLMNARSPFQTL